MGQCVGHLSLGQIAFRPSFGAMLCVPQSFSGFCPSTLRMRNACEVSFTTAFAPAFAVFYGILLDVAGPKC